MLTVGSLFSGIGGIDLGLERAGMRTVWFCEQDEFCQRVLAHHWPDLPCYPDVQRLSGADVRPVDVLAGGFPCQDISDAGLKQGITGARSGLWSEMFRLVCELRPRYLLVENVAALVERGLDAVLADLAKARFDAEWTCLRSSNVGAPHERERIWLVATPQDADGRPVQSRRLGRGAAQADQETAANASVSRLEGAGVQGTAPDHAARAFDWREYEPAVQRWEAAHGTAPEPFLSGMDARLPDRMDRLAAIGNSVQVQVAEWLGRRILEYESRVTA